MYAQFLKLSCDAEIELDAIAHNKNASMLQNSLTPGNLDKYNVNAIDRNGGKGVCGERFPALFHQSKYPNVCGELIDKAREMNGNNQRMFLLSTKNRNATTNGAFYWIDPKTC